MSSTVVIAPSVLSADVSRLADEVAAVEEGGADWIHVDVMDGNFVPDITFGLKMLDALAKLTKLPLDVHLMVNGPERYIDGYADAGASVLTLHPEATIHVQRHLDHIRERGMKAGLALNPGSSLTLAREVLADLDLLLIMTVNPGYAGQRYLGSSNAKIRRARELLEQHSSPAVLEVDGGIGRDTIAEARSHGATAFVAGSAIFGADDPAQEVRELRHRCEVHLREAASG